MAKIYEEIIILRLSKLLKNTDGGIEESLINDDAISSLEQVAQELVGEDVIVEVERTST